MALIRAPLRALATRGDMGIVTQAMLEGIECVAPILNLVEAQAAAAEARAELGAGGARDHAAGATRVEDELVAMLRREEARWAHIGDALALAPDDSDMDPDDLATLLGVEGPTAHQESFDACMRDPSWELKLGPALVTKGQPRDLTSIARQSDPPPIGRSETDAFRATSVTNPTRLANAPSCGLCVRGASGDNVLLGDGTCVAVQDGSYTRSDVSAIPDRIAQACELSTLRLSTGKPPTLTPSARAALATCLHTRQASVGAEASTLGPFVLFGAAIAGSSSPVSAVTKLAYRARELRRARGNTNAIAAALLMLAFEILRVHVCEGDPIDVGRISTTQSVIDVGRLRWCRISGSPVFWIPLRAGDPDLVGGADQPWTLDIPAAGATWHPQSPVMSLDPDWHARIVVVPGDANLWCLDPQGVWWSLDSDFEAVLEGRRAHIQPWLETLENMEKEVPARVNRLRAAAKARHTGPDPTASKAESDPATKSTASASGPERFSREWVLERAKRYAYQSDESARAAGARAATNGQYSLEDFLAVVRWKAPRAIPRAERNRALDVEQATRAGFDATDEVTRVAQLIRLDGVGLPMASALLHFAFPDIYPILDFRALHALGDTTRRTQYSPAFWADYVKRCQRLAEQAGVSIRDLDKALWQDSHESGPGAPERSSA